MKSAIHKLCIFPLVIFLWTTLGFAQQNATTDDGKKVLLKKDGTWEYTKDEPKKTTTFDFRKVAWGMSKKQVKATESNMVVVDNDSVLAYTGRVSGKKALISYSFTNSKLVQAIYVFLTDHTNKNDYIVDYENVKETLTNKYGTPKSDDVDWRNDLYKSDDSEWGFAISLGHLNYRSNWETESSEITLLLTGENYKIQLITKYASKQFEGLEETARQKKINIEF